MSVTLTRATEMRDAYEAAELAILKGQSYEIAGRKLTRADLAEVRRGRKEWQRKVDALSGNSRRGTRIVPRD